MSNNNLSLYEQLEPRYLASEGSLPLTTFAKVESLLLLGEKCFSAPNALQLYLLLTEYQQIGKTESAPTDYLLQQAKINLSSFRSKKIWIDTLSFYCADAYQGLRLFEVDFNTGTYTRTASSNIPYPKRDAELEAFLQRNEVLTKSAKSYARNGTFTFLKNFENKEYASIILGECTISTPQHITPPERTPQSITFSLNELHDAAKRIQEIIPTDPCYKVITSNLFSDTSSGTVAPCTEFTLQHVTNMIGMVGAGKSTFVKILTFLLANREKRVVLVLDTVADVLKTHGYFQTLGVNSSPLIGKSERLKYINQINQEEAMLLSEDYANFLTPACLMDGFDSSSSTATVFGKEPCTMLQKGNKAFTCPYFSICPATLMDRQAYTSNIIITTAPALVSTRIGAARELFLNVALKSVDLIIFDECDRVQKALDAQFTPATSFNTFIQQSASECARFIEQNPMARRYDKNTMYYDGLLLSAPNILNSVLDGLQLELAHWNRIISGSSFSGYTLLENLHNDSVRPLLDDVFQQLYSLLTVSETQPTNDCEEQLRYAFEFSCQFGKDTQFQQALSKWLTMCNLSICNKSRSKCKICTQTSDKIICEEMKNQIALILKIIYFDHYIATLEDAYRNAEDAGHAENELFGFLRTRFTEQQNILPSAPLGNLFGLKKTNDNDVHLFKQYAYGRSLMTDLPWLTVDEQNHPTGPNVLLLSGSSWAPGSYEYHVHRKVNYLIETDAQKAEFLSKTKFIDMGLSTRISGSSIDQRDTLLAALTKEALPIIKKELDKKSGKILIVVNSYHQADVVQKALDLQLAQYSYSNVTAALVQDSSNANGHAVLKRGEVYKFHDKKASILIAPAVAIERGHNIVDEFGHSSLNSIFFFVRPMPVPDDIGLWNLKLNGFVSEFCNTLTEKDILKRNHLIRKNATAFWEQMSKQQHASLAHLSTERKEDVVATLFVLILQIFGRMARITDLTKTPPRVYFADGAFRARENISGDFDFLSELRKYLDKIMELPEYQAIAKTLYGPFHNAFKKGIQ